MVSPAAGLTAIKTIPTIELILIVGMVLYIDNEFYVIQILESFYVEIIIFPVIFDGQTPMLFEKNGDFHSADEFLSGFKKTDRLHPVISLCVYYGESEWDGPFSLKDMLEIPEKIEPLVSDYRMNLVQVRSSGELCFSDPDVNMVFDMSRLIYARDYAKIKEVYSDHDIPADLGVVIGAITESQKLINHALELEQRGGQINMCNALEELRQEGIEEGRLEGRQEGRREGRWEGILEGIRATVRTCRNFNISEADTVRNIMNEFSLSQEEAVNYVKKYW